VKKEDKDHRRQRLGSDAPRAPDEDEKAKTDLRERQRELGRRRGFKSALAQKLPQRREDRCKEDDVDRVDRLEERGRNRPDVDIAIGIEVEAAASLFKQAPEQWIKPYQEEDGINT